MARHLKRHEEYFQEYNLKKSKLQASYFAFVDNLLRQ